MPFKWRLVRADYPGVPSEVRSSVDVGAVGVGSSAPASVPPPTAAFAVSAPLTDRPAVVSRQRSPRLPKLGAVAAAVVVAVALLLILLSGGDRTPDRAIAQAINLRPSDVPGFTAKPVEHSTAGQQLDSKMQRCIGVGVGHHAGSIDVSSPQFASGAGLQAQQVSSDVALQRSSALVTSDLALIRAGRVGACLSQALDGAMIPSSSGVPVTISRVQVASLPVLAQGSNGTFGMRVTMSMSASGISVPTVMDLFGFAVGRDELSMLTFAIAQPFPAVTEERLSGLLISRALSNPH